MDVLVTGADQRQGLAVIRALGSKGLKVFAAGLEPNSLGFFSRYTQGFCRYPSPLTDKKGCVAIILKAVREYRIPVVFPAVESTVIALDEFRDEFEGLTRLALPPREVLHLALDKKETLTLAKELNIPIPQTRFVTSAEEALSFAEEVGYPIVMKPRAMFSYDKVKREFRFKVAYARDREDLKKHLQLFSQEEIYPILQEYCPGFGVCHGVLYVAGELLGLYQWKRVREYPLTGGVVSLLLSVPVDPELQEWTQHLLKAMKWDGVAMVEYRVNELTGKKVLMEVNGRVWGSLSAANKSGLNFPYALYHYMKDGVKEKLAQDYPIGKRNRYLRGDLVALVNHWRGHNPDYLQPLPGRGRALLDFLRDFRPGVGSDIWDLQDPSPGVHEVLSLIMKYGRQIPAFFIKKIFKGRTE